jgi:hypothetical protein
MFVPTSRLMPLAYKNHQKIINLNRIYLKKNTFDKRTSPRYCTHVINTTRGSDENSINDNTIAPQIISTCEIIAWRPSYVDLRNNVRSDIKDANTPQVSQADLERSTKHTSNIEDITNNSCTLTVSNANITEHNNIVTKPFNIDEVPNCKTSSEQLQQITTKKADFCDKCTHDVGHHRVNARYFKPRDFNLAFFGQVIGAALFLFVVVFTFLCAGALCHLIITDKDGGLITYYKKHVFKQ